jgi:predicted dehydrogenase
MVKVAVIGVGSIGAHHARVFSELPDAELLGVVDIDLARAQNIASRYNCAALDDYTKIIGRVDAVSIAVPTSLHYQIGMDFLKNGKDILIEKPITSTLEEAEQLVAEAARQNLILQVGHLERFNAGLSMISSLVHAPRFIESRRLSPFLGRSTDIDVTLDLMIHDIDIILSLVNSEISELRATGSKVLTDNIDIAYAWIEFEDGCIAEAVASRMANERVRELKIFQQNAYIKLDYQTQEVLCYKKIKEKVGKVARKTEDKEPLKEQLASFVGCVKKRAQPLVSGTQGKEALKVALKISEMIKDGTATKTE